MNTTSISQIRNNIEQLRPQLALCETLSDFQKLYDPLLKQFSHKIATMNKKSSIYSKAINLARFALLCNFIFLFKRRTKTPAIAPRSVANAVSFSIIDAIINAS